MKQLIINRNDLEHNIKRVKTYVREISQNDDYKIIAIVKGNGYGLGLKQYSQILVENGIEYLAVATIEEALMLSKEKMCKNILMLSPIYDKKDLEEAIKNNIIITIDSKESVKLVNELATKGYNIRTHIKIDTGFGRYGFVYKNHEEILQAIKALDKNIKIEGIFSHFSDSYCKNNKHTLKQFKRFEKILAMLEENDIKINLKHICSSPAILNYPEMHLNSARLGSVFTGRVCSENNIGLKKIGELEISIAEVKVVPPKFNISYLNSYKTKKETKIAVIPIGYFEGYHIIQNTDMFRLIDKLRRAFREIKSIFKKRKLTVEINNKRYNIIGTIRYVSYNSRYNGHEYKNRRYCYFRSKSNIYI